MRYAIISDVHGNLEALKSVLKAIGREGVNSIWFLGDAVGYGPNPNDAKAAVKWTKNIMTKKNASILKDLPITKRIKDKGILLVHATPKEPQRWHYMFTLQDARLNFRFFPEKLCFIGHTHQPSIVEHSPRGKLTAYMDGVEIKDYHRYIVNAGSVGQPRDGNPDACYVIYSKNIIEIKRVPYDILLTQKKMHEAGLPLPLIERLAWGT
ncbi:MAG: metallophosphoesterase family protein [Nitrospirae bacterium]|nr:metallophosphoesterase family protein [Nitrospirota bacterium]